MNTIITEDPTPEIRIAWTVMAEVADPVTGEPTWLRNDITGGEDPQREAASPVWDLLEAQGHTLLSTVTCPTELACPDCGTDITSPFHGETIPC